MKARRNAPRARAWLLLIAGGVLVAAAVVGIVVGVASGWLDPHKQAGTDAGPFLAGYRVGLWVVIAVSLFVVPWRIASAIARRRLRSRADKPRIADIDLDRLTEPVRNFVRESRLLRAAIEQPLSNWAGFSMMNGTALAADDPIAVEIEQLGAAWRAADAALDQDSARRLEAAGSQASLIRELLDHAYLRARGRPSSFDVTAVSADVLEALESVDDVVARAYGLPTPWLDN